MKKMFLCLAFLLTASVCFAFVTDDFSGAPDLAGFRGLKWGDNASNIPGLAILSEYPFMQRYSRANDQLRIGDIGLESVIYNFYKGRFMGVSIQARGADNWKTLKSMMFEKFGSAPDDSPNNWAEQYEWRAGRSVTHLQYFKKSGAVKLWIVSAEISGLKNKDH